MSAIISLAILIMSVVVHEVSHGLMANRLGDPTARLQGRLTLNPLKHIDMLGSIIVPILIYVMSHGTSSFGWAKPVPFNPYNLKNKKQGEFLIALAGPVSNMLMAIIFGTIIRFSVSATNVSSPFIGVLSTIVGVNLVLAIFNLIPVPPLDGSKLLFSYLPLKYQRMRMRLENYGPIFVVLVVYFLWQFILPVITYLFSLVTGAGAVVI